MSEAAWIGTKKTLKVCCECKVPKERTAINFNVLKQGYLHSRCKDCSNKIRNEWKKDHPEHIREYYRKHRRENPELYRKVKLTYWNKHKRDMKEYNNTYSKNNRYKINAQARVYVAVRKGVLVRPKQCERCFADDRQIVAHHPDYSKPLDVQWICKPCHHEVHNEPVSV